MILCPLVSWISSAWAIEAPRAAARAATHRCFIRPPLSRKPLFHQYNTAEVPIPLFLDAKARRVPAAPGRRPPSGQREDDGPDEPRVEEQRRRGDHPEERPGAPAGAPPALRRDEDPVEKEVRGGKAVPAPRRDAQEQFVEQPGKEEGRQEARPR